MIKVSEFRRHASECRSLAERMTGEHREMLLQMAKSWELLAEWRERELKKQGLTVD
jgi:hypothetical protein